MNMKETDFVINDDGTCVNHSFAQIQLQPHGWLRHPQRWCRRRQGRRPRGGNGERSPSWSWKIVQQLFSSLIMVCSVTFQAVFWSWDSILGPKATSLGGVRCENDNQTELSSLYLPEAKLSLWHLFPSHEGCKSSYGKGPKYLCFLFSPFFA